MFQAMLFQNMIYEKNISKRYKNKCFILDRSMNSDRFKNATGYKSPSWEKYALSCHE